MSELAYLGLAVVISTVGSSVIWFRRGRPQSLESGVQQFSRGLEALAAGPRSVRKHRFFSSISHGNRGRRSA